MSRQFSHSQEFCKEIGLDPIVVLVEEFFRFLLAAPFAKFFAFLLFLLVLYGMSRINGVER